MQNHVNLTLVKNEKEAGYYRSLLGVRKTIEKKEERLQFTEDEDSTTEGVLLNLSLLLV